MMDSIRPTRTTWCLGLACVLTAAVARGQDANRPQPELSVEQAQLADRFERLEEVIGRLAELSAATDPRRAELLRQAIAQSREQDVHQRFETIVNLLEEERLSAAASSQTELQKELGALLNLLLSADRDDRLASRRQGIRAYLKELGRLLRLQRDLHARTEGGDDIQRLEGDQERVADQTGQLRGTISENETEKPSAGQEAPDPSSEPDLNQAAGEDGEPNQSEPNQGEPGPGQPTPGQPNQNESNPAQPAPGQPSPGQPGGDQPPPLEPRPVDRALERLRAAQQAMEQALQKLEQAQRANASDRQRQAIQELELARADLERVLRQLREEEIERTLTQLAARFRKMLEVQTAVYEGTTRIDKVALAERGHEEEIESARLSREEAMLVREAEKALVLLREEGSSVAFPEAVEQIRDDMEHVRLRLSDFDVGELTQALETDIMAALEETIAALDRALKESQERQQRGGQQGGGEPSERALVDVLAELKMIRSLQVRVYHRTQQYYEMIGGDQAATPELLELLRRLAERQSRVLQATADLSKGRNVE